MLVELTISRVGNNVYLEKGTQIDLPDSEARRLIERGKAKPAKPQEAKGEHKNR